MEFLDRKQYKPRYLVCNADESEPGIQGSIPDDNLPHLLIEGLINFGYALG